MMMMMVMMMIGTDHKVSILEYKYTMDCIGPHNTHEHISAAAGEFVRVAPLKSWNAVFEGN